MNHNLAIITVIYENYNLFTDFLDSLKAQSNKDFHLFVVDVSTHKQLLKTGSVPFTLIEAENKGYADGINIGIIEAQKQGFKHFCAMNYDTFFEKNFVNSILSSLKAHPASIIGGKIYYAPGYEYHKERYSKNDLGKVIWFAGGDIDWNHVITPHRGVNQVDKGQFDKVSKVDFVTGCLMCFDEKVVEKVGYWDTKYLLYYEDSDYCVRASKKGVELIYDPSIVLWHKNGQITEGPGSEFHQKYQEKNRLIFGLKYAPLRTKFHLIKNQFLHTVAK
jgi:GT2 family glycosyltransferase